MSLNKRIFGKSTRFFFCFLVVAIKNGREISRFTGVVDENRIQKMIDQLSR